MEALINGIKMRYDDVGSGTTIVLLHAFPLSSAMWQPQVDSLSKRYRLIVPDLRGFGGSDAPPDAYLMEHFADDIAELLDRLGIDQVILGGLSMGGYIAFSFMRRHPERVKALILADTRSGADTPEGKAGRETNARLAEDQGAAAIAEKMIPGLVAPEASQGLRDTLRSLIVANTPQGIAGALRGMALRMDTTPMLPSIKVPALIIVGTEDTLTPPEAAREMHAAIPDSRLVEIPQAGHLSNLEQPVAFNAALDVFLGGL